MHIKFVIVLIWVVGWALYKITITCVWLCVDIAKVSNKLNSYWEESNWSNFLRWLFKRQLKIVHLVERSGQKLWYNYILHIKTVD